MKLVSAILQFYRPRFNRAIVSLLQTNGYRLDRYLAAFWQTRNFNSLVVQPDGQGLATRNETLRTFVDIGGLAEAAFGIILIILGANGDLEGGIYLGVAAIIAYPLVWAHLLVIPTLVFRLPGLPKELGRQIVFTILANQVRQLRLQYDFKVIAVAGSVGKTSTKFAIAETLESKLKIAWQRGNYNDPISVPLVIFGQEMPGIFNVFEWIKIFLDNSRIIKTGYEFDAVVLELGTDGPGDIAEFSKYLKVDIGVLTAVAPEHIEFFGTLENVAREELTIAKFSTKLLVNNDLVASEYLAGLKNYETYGFENADWLLTNVVFKSRKHSFDLEHNNGQLFSTKVGLLSHNQLYGVIVASAVATELGLTIDEVKKAVGKLNPVNGRLKPLKGIKNSTILDDSYNSAPEAAIAALETLYKIKAPQKIAILGSMNELGSYSPEAHRQVGEFCDPKKLDLVVTVGGDAASWLAPAAKTDGCKVKTYDNPYAAGAFVKGKIKKGALVLVKGSQNGVFSEEAVKLLLKNKVDTKELVRQSPAWLANKEKCFSR